MKKVLLVTDVPFWLQQKGNHQRITAMIAYFADYFQMTVVFLGIEKPQIQDDRFTVIHVCQHRGLSALAWRLFGLAPGRLQQTIIRVLNTLHFQRPLDSFGNDYVLDQFSSIYNTGNFDAVIIEYIWHGYLAKAVPREQSLLLLDTHDVFHQRVASYGRFGRTPDKTVTREQELAVYEKFDRLIAIQPVEFDYLENLFPGHVVLAMHPVNAYPERYTERIRKRIAGSKLILVYFAGYSDANIDAINWFVDEVWNSDLAKRFELQIHGAICDSLRISITGVNICGRSPNVDVVYENADIAINPQRFGSGLKIKTIEAMGYGVPVLTTSVGAEGLEEAADQALLCASDSAGMQKLLHSLTDVALRSSLSHNALDFVAGRLTPETCFGPLRQLIEEHRPVNTLDS